MTQEAPSSQIEQSVLAANLAELYRAARRGWKLIGLTTLIACVLAVVSALITPPVYRARVTLMPQQSNMGNSLLLAQLSGPMGLSLPNSGTMEEMYSEIVRSDWMLNKMLELSWPSDGGQKRVSLYEALGYKEQSTEVTNRILASLKTQVVSFQRSKLNGFMEILVDFPREPQLATELANALADSLAGFVRSHHMNSARDKRMYIENRLATTNAELSAAQDSLMEFADDNVSYENSPTLRRAYNDLLRAVTAKSATWIELTRQMELARLEENDTTVKLAILDRARVPLRPIRPKRRVMVMVGTFLGFTLGLAVILLKEQFAAKRASA